MSSLCLVALSREIGEPSVQLGGDGCAETMATGIANGSVPCRIAAPAYRCASSRIKPPANAAPPLNPTRTTRRPVGATSEVGYRDPTTFRRLFQAHTGLTPAAYRQRFRTLPPAAGR